ncbi:MAG: DUF4417 domain-containing protein [Bradymonadia bacterium]|jgi:hypothetical protein
MHDDLGSFLVYGAQFDGRYEMPVLAPIPANSQRPAFLLPFDKRKRCNDKKHGFVHFYMDDVYFKQFWRKGCRYIEELRAFAGVISPDFSLYRDMPLTLQIYNTYRSRALGYYLQHQGLCVVPNVRWGDERSYAFCFDGLASESVYAISSHGCVKSIEERRHFVRGLAAMIERLRPKTVWVHGRMHDRVFGEFKTATEFVRYPSWLEMVKEGSNGNGD